MEEVVDIYCKEINGNGDGIMFFRDIRGKVDNGGGGNRSWGNMFGLPLKQFVQCVLRPNRPSSIDVYGIKGCTRGCLGLLLIRSKRLVVLIR